MDASRDRLARALDATGALIAGIRNDQWANATPCPEWNVRTLVNHVVFGNRMFADVLRGEPLRPPETLRQMRDVDHLGEDPVKAFRESGDALQAAFADPSVFQRVFQVPAGRDPGAGLSVCMGCDRSRHAGDGRHGGDLL